MIAESTTEPGNWELYFQDIAFITADGTVYPIYSRQPNVSLSTWASPGMSGVGSDVHHWAPADAATAYDTTTTYYHQDHLGSARLLLSTSGWPVWQGMFLPFGQEWNPQSTANHYKYTDMEQDGETGLNHTWFRQQSPAMGRWLTPDPAGLAAADLSNPQSLNRYAYVMDNPINLIDPLGL